MILRQDTEIAPRGTEVKVLQTSDTDPEYAMVEYEGIVFPVHWDELAEEQDWEKDTDGECREETPVSPE